VSEKSRNRDFSLEGRGLPARQNVVGETIFDKYTCQKFADEKSARDYLSKGLHNHRDDKVIAISRYNPIPLMTVRRELNR